MLPAILLALTLRTIDAFRVFDIVFVTTAGGPGDATTTLMLLAVKEGLSFFDIGRASAISNAMLLCIAAIAAVYIVSDPRRRPQGERAMKWRARFSARRLFLLALLAFFLAPFLWLATTAYKPSVGDLLDPAAPELHANARSVPQRLRGVRRASLVESSLLIAGFSTLLSLMLGVPAGYALARSESRLAMAVAYGFMGVRMIPAVAALIPFYLMMRDLHTSGKLGLRRAHQRCAELGLRHLDDVLLFPRPAEGA